MGLEVHYVQRAAPRVRARRAKAKVRTKKLRFFRGAPFAADAVLDISAQGMKLLAKGKALAPGTELHVEVLHPALEGPIEVDGIVRWSRPEPDGARFTAGVHFQDLPAQARERLERVVQLELGSAVLGHAGQVGWVARAAADSGLAGLYFVYDLAQSEVATIVDEKEYLHATRVRGADVDHRQGGSVEALLRWVFDLREGDVRVEPPFEAA